ncbi:MAG: type II secretion system protein N [Pseudomonadales bacterium]|nr:type II secretion system protein N [Pseudomonadales bacterium]
MDRKHWLICAFSVAVAFSAGLLANFPASIAFERLRSQLPPKLAEMIGEVEGSVWSGQSTITDGSLKSTVNWELAPIGRLFGGYGLVLHVHDADHDLWIKADAEGEASGRVQVNGKISKDLVNRQLAEFGIRINQDIVVESLSVSMNDTQFSDAGGAVIWKGGRVSYTSSGTKTVQMPELTGLLSASEGTLVLNVVKHGMSEPISVIRLQPDGWLGVEVKQEMGNLILLPNRRLNRAGNVMEIKRKIY